MDSKERTVWVRSATVPANGEVTASYAEIAAWLKDTSPAQIGDAGFGFSHGASMLELIASSMLTNASKLAHVWGGPAAVDTQRALRMLHTTGTELAAEMRKVSQVLRTYGEVHLPEALKKLDKLEASRPKAGEPATTASTSPDSDGTTEARALLRTLNGQIVALYHQVPEKFTYTLPVSGTSGENPGGYTPTDYSPVGQSTGGSQWSGHSRPGAAGTGSGGSSGGSGGPGGSDGPGGSGGQGGGQDGSGSDGSGPGGSNGGQGGQGADGSGTGGTDAKGQTSANGTGPGQGPGGETTVPAVIGGDGTTLQDGLPKDDSRTTEVATFTPRNPVVPPTIQQNAVVPLGPTTTTLTPHTPSVLGGPGFGAGVASTPATLGGRNATGGSPMMPFLPGGGAGAGGESEGQERSTWLSEDHDVWNSRGDVIPPVIT
ncbi:hypothetical protein [Streptosporangium carneum]|uniref:Uncharacterized protein n=1 Tax=Streptosporangium carneum TaxID=47481 RepID=A0A9W6I8B0_9ACTN|nr:hypothetical protein [Streptosporangium carneum]GLK13597.1 hypothetical protein GCM10017600_70080 [Streptosporangium carneum]